MSISTINRLILMLAHAFKGIGADVPMAHCERLAMLIQHSMDHGGRVYHTSAHLFDLCEGMNPRQTLAGLFHDIVYYQLDNGFPKGAEKILKSLTLIDNNKMVLKPFDEDDLPLKICACIFAINQGDSLPLFSGANEFFSAILALRLLKAYLPVTDLIAIAACIEATIPFRGPDIRGRQPSEIILERIRGLCGQLGIGISETEVEKLATDAVQLGNRDVFSFSVGDPDYFLSATWQLIEEANAPINPAGVYSIQEYRSALLRMEKFLGSLNPKNVFHSYRNTPDCLEMERLHLAASNNIEFAVKYIRAKIAAIALVEALALMTGGDCPISMLLGEINNKQCISLSTNDFPPRIFTSQTIDPDLMHALEINRNFSLNQDLNESPLTKSMRGFLGPDKILVTLQQAKLMFSGEISPREFLAGQEPDLVRFIAQGCAGIAFSRSEALLALDFISAC